MTTIVDTLADFAVEHRLQWNSDDTNRPTVENGLEWNDDGFTYRTATPESRDAVVDILWTYMMEHANRGSAREFDGTVMQAAENYYLMCAGEDWWASEPGIFITGVLQMLERLEEA
ncbi:hypothetical protein SEA_BRUTONGASTER_135 [Gordonia phage BrutonGaster]|uniref:Uncharacterized protein n=1 Tax=Gordonia phage BrutonGaster TaxID=2530116 RepID=A0A482JLQ5_9CAUD|nr:hypothetical protein HOV26_gp047 [Gordonia phage BrutonGaster]QBP33349.1 hypothetical protein SEA_BRUTONGASTER_135 [Gordonia phage BrutonGaster]